MPHIIIEHSDVLPEGLPRALHDNLTTQETIIAAGIKTRSIRIENAIIGDGSKEAMVHIALKLLPGRSDELKTTMSQGLAETAKQFVNDNTSVTVEVIDLHADSYIK